MITTTAPVHYTEQVQKRLNAKTKPEPWLHAVVLGDGNNFTYASTKDKKDAERIVYAIYVWDTREVVETGVIDCADNSSKQSSILLYFKRIGRNSRLKAFLQYQQKITVNRL